MPPHTVGKTVELRPADGARQGTATHRRDAPDATFPAKTNTRTRERRERSNESEQALDTNAFVANAPEAELPAAEGVVACVVGRPSVVCVEYYL